MTVGQPYAERGLDPGIQMRLHGGSKFGVSALAAENEFEAELRAAECSADINKVAGSRTGALHGAPSFKLAQDGDADRNCVCHSRIATNDTDPEFSRGTGHSSEQAIKPGARARPRESYRQEKIAGSCAHGGEIAGGARQ